jgi:hypothetical protein
MKSSGYFNTAEPWKPKEQRTVMANPPEGLTVTRDQMPERIASELPQQYIAKGQTSFQQSGFLIPPGVSGPVLNHMRVALCTSANTVDRRRSYENLVRMRDAGDESAKAALEAMNVFTLE